MKDPIKRRQTVSWKKLCFSCLKYGHRAADCPPRTWFKCNRKHHKSLCVNNQLQDSSSIRHQETKEKMMLPLEIREFATLLWLSMQLQFSVEPQWTLVLEVATPQYLWSVASAKALSYQKRDKWKCCYTPHQQKLKYTISSTVIKRVPLSLM